MIAKLNLLEDPPLPPFDPPPPPQLSNMPICSQRRYYWIIDYPIGEGELQ